MKTLDDLLEFISDHLYERGYAPSVREVAKFMGYSSASSAHLALRRLRSKGLVDWEERQPRTLRVVDAE